MKMTNYMQKNCCQKPTVAQLVKRALLFLNREFIFVFNLNGKQCSSLYKLK
jgi:hypothetical protein